MGSCYSGGHIARGRIHKDVTTLNTGEPQQPWNGQ